MAPIPVIGHVDVGPALLDQELDAWAAAHRGCLHEGSPATGGGRMVRVCLALGEQNLRAGGGTSTSQAEVVLGEKLERL